MPKLNLDNKALTILVISAIVLSSALFGYTQYKINSVNQELNTKLLLLNEEIITNLNDLQQNINQELSSLKNNLTLEVELLETRLETFKDENEKDLNALNNLIDEIEKQSDIRLNELKEEISTIQVQSADFSAIIDDVVKSVVSVGTNVGQGSGVVIDDEGFIVTNYHVVERASIIRILTYDNKVYDAQLIGYNDIVDVAVLKVNANLDSLRFGDSDDVKVGERVIALGNPAGLSFTVTEGIVSAVHRKGTNNLDIYIQTDVPINPGNSGGPLVNTNSRIIGINNFKIGGFEGLGFAIESNVVEGIAEDIIAQYNEQ